MTETNSEHTQTPSSDAAGDEGQRKEAALEPASRQVPAAVVLMASFAVLLVVLLVVLNLMGKASQDRKSGAGSDLAALESQAVALKSQLNQQRLALGLQPLADASESVEQISDRLRKDAETMVGLANSFREMLAVKDAELSAQTGKLLQSEQMRQVLAQEVTRLKAELQKPVPAGSDPTKWIQEIEQLKNERDGLNAELAVLKAGQQGVEDVAELKRRLEETTRAKEFFEAKVKELESTSSKTGP